MKKIFLLLIATIAISMPAAQANDWPVYGADNNRSFYTTETATFPMGRGWVYKGQAIEPMQETPSNPGADFDVVWFDRAPGSVVVSNRVYASSATEECVYCLDVADGTLLWRVHAEGAVRAAPSYDDGKLYFGADDGFAYCVDAETGALLWKEEGSPEMPRRVVESGRLSSAWPVRTGVTVEDGLAYFGAGLLPPYGNYLTCVDIDTEAVQWRSSVDFPLIDHILLSSNELFVSTGRVAPAEYNRTDGAQITQGTDNRRSPAGPGVRTVGDLLVYGPNENGVLSIRATTNLIDDKFLDTDARVRGSFAYYKATRMTTDGTTLYIMHGDENQNGLGDEGEKSLIAMPYSDATNLFYEAADNCSYRMNKANYPYYWGGIGVRSGANRSDPFLLQDIWSNRTWATLDETLPDRSMLLTDNAVFLGGSNVVSAYSRADGSNLWSGAVTGTVYDLSFSDGALYAGTTEGYVYCFRSSDTNVIDDLRPAYSSPYPTNDALYSKYVEAAELAITNADTTKGFCLVLGASEGRLAYEIATRSDFFVVGLETDPDKAAVARTNLMQTGLYGSQVVIHEDLDELFPHPDYFVNLIVSEELLFDGTMPYSSQEIFRMLQPYGGTVLFGNKDGNLDLTSWVGSEISAWQSVSSAQAITWKLARRGAPAGFGAWAHPNATPANVFNSGDETVDFDLRLQWMGEVREESTPDRHDISFSPLVDQGRMFCLKNDLLVAVDAYNATILWEKELPGVIRLVAPLDAPQYQVDGEMVYVAVSNICYVLDAQTGEELHAFPEPTGDSDWGYVAVVSNILFGSSQTANASVHDGATQLLYAPSAKGSWTIVSHQFFAKDPDTGIELWSYTNGVILNSSITFGDTNVYFTVSRNSAAVNDADGRVALADFLGGDCEWVALDFDGNEVWTQPLGRITTDTNAIEVAVFGTYAEDRLITVGTWWPIKNKADDAHYLVKLLDTTNAGAQVGSDIVYDGGQGGSNTTDHNGTLMRPLIANHRAYLRLYKETEVQQITLADGSTNLLDFIDPGGQKGCSPMAASANYAFYRSYSIEGINLTSGQAQNISAVTRPNCWPSILPANGLILMPESSASCVCGMAIQTSIALAPVVGDDTAPSLFNVVATDSNTVIVVFNEALDEAIAENTAHYTIAGVSILSATRQTNHLERVTLNVSALPPGTNTLTVSDIEDLHDNVMPSAQQMEFVSDAEDTDGDGLPDIWEQQIIDADPGDGITSIEDVLSGDDFDGDGLSNGDEYIAGTDPTDPFSTFQAGLVIGVPSSVISWDPMEGRSYAVYWTSNLLDGFTTVLASNLIWPQAAWTDTLHTAEDAGFYRVKVVK